MALSTHAVVFNAFMAMVSLDMLLLAITNAQTISNEKVLIDMVQNNPGDAVSWEFSKYFDGRVLKDHSYTAQCTTGENSGTQAVDFHTTGIDFFPANSTQRAWLDAYAKGVDRFVSRAKEAGVKAYFFVDLIVFPTFVIDHYKDNITSDGKKIVWNTATEALVNVMIDETFERYPDCDGFVVRTGETYTYDTPFHAGNSPSNGTVDLWVSFITSLRESVCEKHNKDLFFRSWDNWPSLQSYYVEMTDRIPTHENLYFSIKHSPGDFTRPAGWNEQLATGKHAQIVEVELQREYEGKASYPNYVLDGVINGFPEMSKKIGLRNITNAPQFKGIWTWSRGGGWWGPYIKHETWIDVHVDTLSTWYEANGAITEEEAFMKVCPSIIGCTTQDCCSAVRAIGLLGSQAVLLGQWCTVGESCGLWMRDDRLGGLSKVSGHFASLKNDSMWAATFANRAEAAALWANVTDIFTQRVAPFMSDPVKIDEVAASIEYGQRLFAVVDAGWRAMGLSYRQTHNMTYSCEDLTNSIQEYRAAMSGYRAFGLINPYAASLYHPYYLCLGSDCNCSFDPPPGDVPSGMGASIDAILPCQQA